MGIKSTITNNYHHIIRNGISVIHGLCLKGLRSGGDPLECIRLILHRTEEMQKGLDEIIKDKEG